MAGAVTFGDHLVFLLLAGRPCILSSVSRTTAFFSVWDRGNVTEFDTARAGPWSEEAGAPATPSSFVPGCSANHS
jgi:hypothetical protein